MDNTTTLALPTLSSRAVAADARSAGLSSPGGVFLVSVAGARRVFASWLAARAFLPVALAELGGSGSACVPAAFVDPPSFCSPVVARVQGVEVSAVLLPLFADPCPVDPLGGAIC